MLAEHQSEAVARCRELLGRYGGALLADEVGLGKSFVAAAVAKEFAEVELIVPVALIEQWRATLARFELDARILTHDGIVSDRFVPRAGRRLVIVDEAHAFRNPKTRRYAALARRSLGAAMLLVTATPVCNSMNDLRALVDLVARDDLLAALGVPSIDVAFESRDREQLAAIAGELVIRRDRSVLPRALQFGALERRVVRHRVPDVRRELEALRFPLVGEHALLRRFLWRRLESSEAALLESLRRQTRFYERALECLAAGRALPKRDYRRAFGHEEDRDAFQQVLFWELFVPDAAPVDPQLIREELVRIDALRIAVERSPQTKRAQLLAMVTSEPTLIFTSSAATARDLARTLRCGLVTSRDRSALAAFIAGKLDVVVSTDVAAEGLNLQRAGVVIHYDIPWNPVKLDQRNGRAHRIGQTRESVRAVYFLPESRETRIVEVIARKNMTRRRVIPSAVEGSRASIRGGDPSTALGMTLRPRLANAAVLALANKWPLPEQLFRRHKAGLERLIAEMSHEYLDQRRVDDLIALV
ncbi:MAG TPA: DEAD/DEAH box helicase [Thermoanaerobaculia bacterium]